MGINHSSHVLANMNAYLLTEYHGEERDLLG